MNFTEKSIEKLQATNERQVFRDDSQTGFGVRVEEKAHGGRKTYFWNQKVGGRVCFRALGECGQIALKDAKAEARQLSGLAAKWKALGCPPEQNPFTKPKAVAKAAVPTFGQLVAAYARDHIRKTAHNPMKAERDLYWTINRNFATWFDRPMDEITVDDVLAVRNELNRPTQRGKRTLPPREHMANRTVATVKAIYAWAGSKPDGKIAFWACTNPAEDVKLYAEPPRDRYLSAEEMVTLDKALEDPRTPEDLRDFVRLALFTGLRKNAILAADWKEIDLNAHLWNVPPAHSKNGKGYVVHLDEEAAAILERRAATRSTSPFIFPPVSGKILHLDKPFQKLCARAGLKNLRIHDLRRSCASVLAAAGQSPQLIAAALGHSDQNMRAVLRYAKLFPEDLQEARAAGAAKRREMLAAATKRMEQKRVVAIK